MNAKPTEIDFTDYDWPAGPWKRGLPVVVEEQATPLEGWSLYSLPGGTEFAVVMEATDAMPSGWIALFALWRVVATLTRTCPMCGNRAVLGESGLSLSHEGLCLLSDGALLEEGVPALADASPLPDDLPPRPRRWKVVVPRLLSTADAEQVISGVDATRASMGLP